MEEDTTMKKKAFAILTLCISLFAAVALVGCGGSGGAAGSGGGSVYVSIDNVEEHKDAVETMMKSLEFADDIAKAKTEAMDVKLDDIEIKR